MWLDDVINYLAPRPEFCWKHLPWISAFEIKWVGGVVGGGWSVVYFGILYDLQDNAALLRPCGLV